MLFSSYLARAKLKEDVLALHFSCNLGIKTFCDLVNAAKHKIVDNGQPINDVQSELFKFVSFRPAPNSISRHTHVHDRELPGDFQQCLTAIAGPIEYIRYTKPYLVKAATTGNTSRARFRYIDNQAFFLKGIICT